MPAEDASCAVAFSTAGALPRERQWWSQVNISSPKTPGLRELQAVESLLVKIEPDPSDSDVDDIAELAMQPGLAGIVATNTTVSRDGLRTTGVDALGAGGVSGPPVAGRAAQILRRL